MPPSGVPEAFLEPVPDALRIARRPLRPQPRALPLRRASPAATRWSRGVVEPPLGGPRGRRRARARRAAPGRVGARVVRRRGGPPAAAGEPRGAAQGDRAGRPAGARALPAGLAARRPPRGGARGRRAARRRSAALQGLALPPPSGRRRCCRAAWPTTGRPGLDELAARGEIVWVGAGAGGVGGGRVAIYFREDAPLLGPPPADPPPEGPVPSALRAALAGGASFWDDLAGRRPDARPRGRLHRAVGAGLGGRGHQRPLAAAARAAPPSGPHAGRAPGGVRRRRRAAAAARRRPWPAAGRSRRASSAARPPTTSGAACWPS